MMVGVNPVSDALGRVNKLEVIPLEELKRPRIDVVVNCSGVFRDLFVNQMNLLDRAIKMAAEQDESEDMNFVRKHAREQVRPSLPSATVYCSHLATHRPKHLYIDSISSALHSQQSAHGVLWAPKGPQQPWCTGHLGGASRRHIYLHSAHRRGA